jgi:hypothetical protein
MSEIPVHTQSDEISAHPRHVGHRGFDITLAVCAIFISAVSLVVAIEHGRTERDLVAASSWPFLRSDISNAFGEARALEIGVSNGGVGPAKIASFEMTFNGHPVGSPRELLSLCCGLPSSDEAIRQLLPSGSVVTAMIDQTVLRPGETTPVLVVARSVDAGLASKLDDALVKIAFHACYCSVLDQCWTTDLKSIDTQSVKSCPVPSHPYNFRMERLPSVPAGTSRD